MHWIRVDRYYEGKHLTIPKCTSSRCRACIARTRHANWSVPWGHGSQQRRAERHGLQPLCRHALLLEQLSVQGSPVQFLPVSPISTRRACGCRRNPEVTVRSRGVMEKCTYCVQRIRTPRSTPQREDTRDLRWRDPDRVSGCLPGRGDHLWRYQRSAQQSGASEGGAAAIRVAGRIEHAAANDLSGGVEESESGNCVRSA